MCHILPSDMNECENPEACGEGGTCINTDGSHMCLCPDGYVLINDKCTGKMPYLSLAYNGCLGL